MLSRPTEWGPQAPRARAGEAGGRAVSSEQAPLISMGPQPSCLKIASGTLLKMLTLQLTFGRSWQAIKPELKIGAAGRERAPGSRDQAGRAEGSRTWAAVPGWGCAFSFGPARPHWGSGSLLEGHREREDAEGKEGRGRRMDMERPKSLSSSPSSRSLFIIRPIGRNRPQREELWKRGKMEEGSWCQ